MKVLIVHNAYRQPGGEDAVVAAEKALLAEYGHGVRLFTVSNDSVTGVGSRLAAALGAPYSPAARDTLARLLDEQRPDVVHVHNFFPLLTPSIYDACQTAAVPVVQTLHNYRLICPVATLRRNGAICEICVSANAYRSVLHGCYRDSRLGTLAVARMIQIHRRRGTWRNKVDRYIALTQFARSKFIEGGLPAEKIVVKPNFVVADHAPAPLPGQRKGGLFVGRLSPEKGIGVLLDAWRELDVPLCVAGDGPLLDEVRGQASPAVIPLGRLSATEVANEMRRAQFLVVPSEWYEGFPVVIAEAYARGLPVIASRLGSLAEIVEDGVTGLHVEPGDAGDLAAKVRWAVDHPDRMHRMGWQAHRRYEERYSPEVNHALLVAIYGEASGA